MNGEYTNGYGSLGPNDTRRDRDAELQPRSRDRRYGYGGLTPIEPQDRRVDAPAPLRSAEIQRRRANRVSGERSWGDNRSPGSGGDGAASKQIDDILHYIQHDWNFMTKDKCVPAQVALQLLDSSSLGLARKYGDFKSTEEQLQSALRAIVNEHHQGFNSSIGTFHQIQESIQASHNRIYTLRESLIDAKNNLTSTKAEFRNLVLLSRDYDDTLEILSTIEKIQQMPEQVEAAISEKQFIRAVDLLQEALKIIRAGNLDDIGALSELRLYLINQENSLVDILTEELHNHLYLKSPYCEERWTSYAKLHGQNRNLDTFESEARAMYGFLEKLDLSVAMVEDVSKNPEADSFQYIYVIVETLARLDRLETAIDSLEERLPVELFKVVERSNGEVHLRHPNAMQSSFRQDKSSGDIDRDTETREVVLDDLLGTLYAKFEAIAESHRVFHEIVTGVAMRNSTWNPRLLRGFKELWKLYQSEIRSLLHDYLSSNDAHSQRLLQGLNTDENIFRHQRDKNKKTTFKMEWVDQTAIELKAEQDEVVTIFQKFVPGIGSLTQDSSSAVNGTAPGVLESSAAGHKLLVEPSVFNIHSLLPPTVFFLKRLRELIPPGSDIVISTLSSFLNDFLINVFYPQFEETIVDHCAQIYAQLDAFQQEPNWFQYSQKPIFKGAVQFYELVISYCKVLDDLTHDQLFTGLITTQMHTYYDKCCAWYKALMTRTQRLGSRTMKSAALMAENGQIRDTVTDIFVNEGDDLDALIRQETEQILQTTDSNPLDESDLISDRKTLVALCLMYNSMKWLTVQLHQLRKISDHATDSTGMEDLSDKPQIKRTLTAALAKDGNDGSTPDVYLPLSHNTAGIFDSIVNGYRELSSLVLRALHLELRCHSIQSLTAALKGSFQLSTPTDVPDEKVLTLITDLLEFNQETAKALQPEEYKLVTTGIGSFLDAVVLHTAARNIKAMNIAGSQHMQLNVRVLYHNILNIEPLGELPRSTAFFLLFEEGPDAIIAGAKAGVFLDGTRQTPLFNESELEILLRWWYSEAFDSHDREETIRAQRELDEKVKTLRSLVSK